MGTNCSSSKCGNVSVDSEVNANKPVTAIPAENPQPVFIKDLGLKWASLTPDVERKEADTLAWLAFTPATDSPVRAALFKHFPGAVPGDVVVSRVVAALEPHGFNPDNTIYGSSICPDEINNEKGDFTYLMQEFWGEVFPMGGIGGAPYVGKTGYGAFSHHVPEAGHVLVMFAPHIAISAEGVLGKCMREGQSEESSACGAVLAAYKQVTESIQKGESLEAVLDMLDMQQSWLRMQIRDKYNDIIKAPEPLCALIHEAYESIKRSILEICNCNFGTGYLVLLGGIQINMPAPFSDHFQPLMFQMLSAKSDPVDLMDTFQFRQTSMTTDLCYEVYSWLNWAPGPSDTCFATLQKYFPTALPAPVVARKIGNLLEEMGITPDNTLYGQSLCSDEINYQTGGLAHCMTEWAGEVFPLGGIGGAPYVGKAGFKAFSSHVPDGGNILILFAPHIAISSEGELGKCQREGQKEMSHACGAVLAGYDYCSKGHPPRVDRTDMQQAWIEEEISVRLQVISKAAEPMERLIREFYDCIMNKMMAIVNTDFGTGHLVIVGGIQINMAQPWRDQFLPLAFVIMGRDRKTLDKLPELAAEGATPMKSRMPRPRAG